MPSEVGTRRRRPTQQERRLATRRAVVVAAADALTEDGYASFTTRSVARRAGVSQATVMHYFAGRTLLLTDAMGLLCDRIVEEFEALEAQLPTAERNGAGMLDRLWERFSSPGGVAIGQVWCAAWADEALAPVITDFDRRHVDALLAGMRRVHPPEVDPDRLAAFVELILATMKGVLLLRPVADAAEIDARWSIVRPLLVRAAADVLDDTTRVP